jgi:recombination protein RecA
MLPPAPLANRREAFAGLRSALAAGYASATPESFTQAEESLVRSGLGELDAALGGGFPRGVLATLEGAPGSGRSAIAARLLAVATGAGIAALIESPGGIDGSFYPPALAAAGVDLERLLVVPAETASSIARATDILLRTGAFGVVVIPAIALSSSAWTRLASLTHRANALVVALGDASDELRYFATLRVRCRPVLARFTGISGLFNALAESGFEATVLKHKRAAPGKRAHFDCTTFERNGAPLVPLHERVLMETSLHGTLPERTLAL